MSYVGETPYNHFVLSAARALVNGKTYRFDRARVLHDLRCRWRELFGDICLETNKQGMDIEEGFIFIIRVRVEVDEAGFTVLRGLPDLIEL